MVIALWHGGDVSSDNLQKSMEMFWVRSKRRVLLFLLLERCLGKWRRTKRSRNLAAGRVSLEAWSALHPAPVLIKWATGGEAQAGSVTLLSRMLTVKYAHIGSLLVTALFLPMGICSKLPASYFSSTLPLLSSSSWHEIELQQLSSEHHIYRANSLETAIHPLDKTILRQQMIQSSCTTPHCKLHSLSRYVQEAVWNPATYLMLSQVWECKVTFTNGLQNTENRKGSLKIAQTALSLLPFPTGLIHLLPAYKLGRLWWKSYWQVYLTPFSFPDLRNSGEERAKLANGEKKDSWVTDCFGTSLQAMSLPLRDWCLVKDI